MADDIGVLRSRLQESNSELFDSLTASWERAQDGWLYAVNVHLGSSNSYPHLRNVERHLDQIVQSFERSREGGVQRPLDGLELYLLLSAVLFHDIGRTQQMGDSHGMRTADCLKREFAHLGIPSKELAHAIARISVCHCPPDGRTRQQMLQALFTTTIEPYGEAREELLAARLTLADCMDGAYTRTLPHFLTEDEDVGPVGLFRRTISGVYADPDARLVRTVLLPDDDSEDSSGESEYSLEMDESIDSGRREEWKELPGGSKGLSALKRILGIGASCSPKHSSSEAPKYASLEAVDDMFRERLSKALGAGSVFKRPGSRQMGYLYRKYIQRKGGRSAMRSLLGEITTDTPFLHGLLSLGLVRLVKIGQPSARMAQKVGIPLPRRAPLAIVLGDMRNNGAVLADIRDVLASCGILLANWVIERNEHLYNTRGNETYEPLFHDECLRQIAQGMWSLSSQIFGACRFTYDDLASYLGDPDAGKIKMGVHRIAVVAEGLCMSGGDGAEEKGAVRAGANHWEWRVLGHAHGRRYVGPRKVMDAISELEPPDAAYGEIAE